MDLPTAALLVVLVALGVVIVIVLEQRLSRIRRRSRAPEHAVGEGTGAAEERALLTGGSLTPAVPGPPNQAASTPLAPPPFDRHVHVLMHREIELATLTTVRIDPPWIECTFAASHAFHRYKPLFDRELELLQHPDGPFEQAAFLEQWQRIFGAGLWIRADPDGDHVSKFLLHIHHDGTARLRYG